MDPSARLLARSSEQTRGLPIAPQGPTEWWPPTCRPPRPHRRPSAARFGGPRPDPRGVPPYGQPHTDLPVPATARHAKPTAASQLGHGALGGPEAILASASTVLYRHNAAAYEIPVQVPVASPPPTTAAASRRKFSGTRIRPSVRHRVISAGTVQAHTCHLSRPPEMRQYTHPGHLVCPAHRSGKSRRRDPALACRRGRPPGRARHAVAPFGRAPRPTTGEATNACKTWYSGQPRTPRQGPPCRLGRMGRPTSGGARFGRPAVGCQARRADGAFAGAKLSLRLHDVAENNPLAVMRCSGACEPEGRKPYQRYRRPPFEPPCAGRSSRPTSGLGGSSTWSSAKSGC